MKHKVATMVTGILAALPGLLMAHGGGMMSGVGSTGMAGTGMMVVADDGSLLVTDMSGTMMGGGTVQPSRKLVDLGPDGNQRWSVEFSDGWPMMPVTHGDLVVVSLVSDWWSGQGMIGDGGWGTPGQGTSQTDSDQVTLVALDLTTGQEVWRTTLDGDMGAMAQFAPDGGRLYVPVVTLGTVMGGGPMHQGDASGNGSQMTAVVYALDPADGHTLWSHEVSTVGGMGGGMMSTRRSR